MESLRGRTARTALLGRNRAGCGIVVNLEMEKELLDSSTERKMSSAE